MLHLEWRMMYRWDSPLSSCKYSLFAAFSLSVFSIFSKRNCVGIWMLSAIKHIEKFGFPVECDPIFIGLVSFANTVICGALTANRVSSQLLSLR